MDERRIGEADREAGRAGDADLDDAAGIHREPAVREDRDRARVGVPQALRVRRQIAVAPAAARLAVGAAAGARAGDRLRVARLEVEAAAAGEVRAVGDVAAVGAGRVVDADGARGRTEVERRAVERDGAGRRDVGERVGQGRRAGGAGLRGNGEAEPGRDAADVGFVGVDHAVAVDIDVGAGRAVRAV